MKLSAFALDYDGTIATDGVLDPAVRQAIAEARSRGIAVILVTGRRLDDLRRVAGDLACFDAIVGENGAVLEFPARGRHVLLAHAPTPAFLDALRESKVEFTAGECVVEAHASAAGAALAVIRALELPLTLTFNRGRLMMLPPAVAKSTGLRQALRALRISIHNTIGIGDAENDHDLLDACEVGVAVEWGSAALRAAADEIVRGRGPAAVADYMRTALRQPRLSSAQMGRRHLLLGYELGGEPVKLALRGRTILISGEPGTGKSWLAGLVCEQLVLQGYCVCVIDPEGDYRALAALPGVMVLGGEDPPPTPRELLRALEHPDESVVIDLSRLGQAEKVEYVQALLRLLIQLRKRTGLPHKILLDEAHYFLDGTAHTDLVDPDLAGYIIVTYRLSALDPAIRTPRDTVSLVTRATDPQEADVLLGMCQPQPGITLSGRVFAELRPNEVALLPGPSEAGGTLRRFTLAPRLTEHVRHRTKYLDMPVIEARAFVFAGGGSPRPRAQTLKEFIGLLETLPLEQLRGHLCRHDFSRWVDEVFRDRPLALRLHALESRVPAGNDEHDRRDVVNAIGQAIRARYETSFDAVGPHAEAGLSIGL